MKKKIFILVSILIIMIIGGVSLLKNKDNKSNINSDNVVTVNGAYGEIQVPVNPEKVVVLSYGTLDILSEIGVSDKVKALPKNNLPEYLAEYNNDDYINLGGIKEFDMEKISELNPDLIIIEGRQADYYEELSEIAPTLYIESDNTDYLGTVKNNIDILGTIFDKKDIGLDKFSSLESRLLEVKNKVSEKNLDASVLFVSDSSISVFGETSRYNIIYNEFGFNINDKNIGDSNHGQSISYEYLLEKNPDYIFIIDKNAVTNTNNDAAKQIMNNELVKSTKAYQNNNIIYLNASAWYVGGPGLKTLEMRIDEINKALK